MSVSVSDPICESDGSESTRNDLDGLVQIIGSENTNPNIGRFGARILQIQSDPIRSEQNPINIFFYYI